MYPEDQEDPAALITARTWQLTLFLGVVTVILGLIVSFRPSGSLNVIAVLLGILMMIPLRRALIVKEHGNLKYPEGTACAAVLTAGASAPEVLVEQVSQRLSAFGFTNHRDLELIREDVRFTLPAELATIAPAPRR